MSVFAVLNSEKRNTEDTKIHGEPQRNRPVAFSRLSFLLQQALSALCGFSQCSLC